MIYSHSMFVGKEMNQEDEDMPVTHIRFIRDMAELYRNRNDRLFDENMELRKEINGQEDEIAHLRESLAYFQGKGSQR